MEPEYVGRVSAEALFTFCVDAFCSVGILKQDAEIVAENLVSANLRGVESHGVIRAPYYVTGIQKGLTNPKPNMRVVRETANTAIIDGDNGLGQIAGMKATELAIKKAKTNGVGIVGVKNTNHVGMLANYVIKIVKQGLIGFTFTNGPPSMAPWGGSNKLLGTNPLCIGFPIDEKNSIILDMATSTVAAGKIASYATRGRKIPPGWALDKYGKSTTDPQEALKGTLTPLGGYKGYGLALAIDILAGILTGDTVSYYVRSGWEAQGGFLTEAIDVTAFRADEEYKKDVLDYIRLIKSCPLAEGAKEILLPGELESREYEKRFREGIPLDTMTWNALQKLSKDLHVRLPTLKAIEPPNA